MRCTQSNTCALHIITTNQVRNSPNTAKNFKKIQCSQRNEIRNVAQATYEPNQTLAVHGCKRAKFDDGCLVVWLFLICIVVASF